jgi:hypothetical protein
MQKTLRTGNRSLLPVMAKAGISQVGIARFMVFRPLRIFENWFLN